MLRRPTEDPPTSMLRPPTKDPPTSMSAGEPPDKRELRLKLWRCLTDNDDDDDDSAPPAPPDQACSPTPATAMRDAGEACSDPFESLPDEIVMHVLAFIPWGEEEPNYEAFKASLPKRLVRGECQTDARTDAVHHLFNLMIRDAGRTEPAVLVKRELIGSGNATPKVSDAPDAHPDDWICSPPERTMDDIEAPELLATPPTPDEDKPCSLDRPVLLPRRNSGWWGNVLLTSRRFLNLGREVFCATREARHAAKSMLAEGAEAVGWRKRAPVLFGLCLHPRFDLSVAVGWVLFRLSNGPHVRCRPYCAKWIRLLDVVLALFEADPWRCLRLNGKVRRALLACRYRCGELVALELALMRLVNGPSRRAFARDPRILGCCVLSYCRCSRHLIEPPLHACLGDLPRDALASEPLSRLVWRCLFDLFPRPFCDRIALRFKRVKQRVGLLLPLLVDRGLLLRIDDGQPLRKLMLVGGMQCITTLAFEGRLTLDDYERLHRDRAERDGVEHCSAALELVRDVLPASALRRRSTDFAAPKESAPDVLTFGARTRRTSKPDDK